MRLRRAAGALAAVVAIAGVGAWSATRPAPSVTTSDLPKGASPGDAGAIAFYGSGFGALSLPALSTNAVPTRIAEAALVLAAHDADASVTLDRAGYLRVMRRFGFPTPSHVANMPEGSVGLRWARPAGVTQGTVHIAPGLPVTVSNLGCAACHSGVGYDASGRPRPGELWLGQPNTSLDLTAYTDAVLAATRRTAGRKAELIAVAERIGPPMGAGERWTLANVVLPLVGRRLSALEGMEHPLAYPGGWPGATNGVPALKERLGTPLAGGGGGETGAVSIPDLADRQWRTALLVDGAYAIGTARTVTARDIDRRHLEAMATTTTFFTIPSMGVTPRVAHRGMEDARAIVGYLSGRRRQPWPGAIDAVAARRGAMVYAARCASCHGTMTTGPAPRLTSYPNAYADVGTDAVRARRFDAALAGAVRASSYGKSFDVVERGRYAAPPLAGLWSSAPYLHNGSVPTLRALLTPSERPRRFLVGGHAIDMDRVGVALAPGGDYPAGYRPWSTPAWFDTGLPGRGNGGHLQGSDLGDADKRALIEYLKAF